MPTQVTMPRVLTHTDGKQFEVETVRPEDLKAGDRVYSVDRKSGYLVILAVGSTEYIWSDIYANHIPRTPVLAYWHLYLDVDIWTAGLIEFSRILREL